MLSTLAPNGARLTRIAQLALAFSFVAVTACSDDDDDEPSNNLTLIQKTRIAGILSDAELATGFFGNTTLSGYGSAVIPVLVLNLQSMGTVQIGASSLSATRVRMAKVPGGVRRAENVSGEYHLFGGQLVVAVATDDGVVNAVWTGVVGVDDINDPDKIFTMGVLDLGATTGPTSITSTSIGGTSQTRIAVGGFATLDSNDDPEIVYSADAGQITLTSITFSGSSNCENVNNVFIESCSRSYGTMAGNFNMSGVQVDGEDTFSIPATTINIPAVRLTVIADVTGSI
jgi:hypothetical protein